MLTDAESRQEIFLTCHRDPQSEGDYGTFASWKILHVGYSQRSDECMTRHNARKFFYTVKVLNILLTRSVCYSDMSFLTTTRFLRDRVLPLRSKYNTTWPETAVQQEISKDPSTWGTYIWDKHKSNPSSRHLNGRFFR